MEVLKTVGTLWDISTSASILKDILGLKTHLYSILVQWLEYDKPNSTETRP